MMVILKQAFKAKEVVDVILGRNNPHTKIYRHDQLEQFGKGVDHDEYYWKAVIRQAVFDKLIYKEIEQYGVLKVSPEGGKFIKSPYNISVTCDHDYSESGVQDDDDDASSMGGGFGSASGDEALYVQLKGLLKSIAQKEKLPLYVIFEDRSLKDMTIQYPCNVEELSHCTGVGINKAQKYGAPFIDLIKKYVEENEIERPQDIVVRSAVNKSGRKVYIIQAIDRKMSLEDIARGKNLTMDELLTEIEHIISSGLKLNIDYYINENIEEDHQEELLEYWRDSESDTLEDAYAEFANDPDYTEEEIRLMRIKFLADYGH